VVFYYSGESGEPLFWNRQEGLNVVAGAYFSHDKLHPWLYPPDEVFGLGPSVLWII